MEFAQFLNRNLGCEVEVRKFGPIINCLIIIEAQQALEFSVFKIRGDSWTAVTLPNDAGNKQ